MGLSAGMQAKLSKVRRLQKEGSTPGERAAAKAAYKRICHTHGMRIEPEAPRWCWGKSRQPKPPPPMKGTAADRFCVDCRWCKPGDVSRGIQHAKCTSPEKGCSKKGRLWEAKFF